MNKNIQILIVFILISIANIIFTNKKNKLGNYITKPLLMPLLILLYVTKVAAYNYWIIIALLLGFLGDVFLMIPKWRLFTPGLVSFLSGHICYIIAFLMVIDLKVVPIFSYVILIPYILYGISIFRTLIPNLNNMKIQCFVYIVVILSMSFAGSLRIWFVSGSNFLLPFLGTILFITSDTLLAFEHFKGEFKNSGSYIMTTYIMAQVLIIWGFL